MSTATQQSATTGPSTVPEGVRLHMFDGGTLKCHVENIKMNQGLGEEYEIPVPWFLIEHPRGLVLIDGGNAAECATDPEGHWGQISTVYWPVMTPEQACVADVEGGRIRPRRRAVRAPVPSAPGPHGRAGRDRPVPQRQRARQARRVRIRVHSGLVRRRRLHPEGLRKAGVPWSILEDNEDGYDVFGDGVIRCWSTPGHAPGHQSFEVTLANSGTMLLTSMPPTPPTTGTRRRCPAFSPRSSTPSGRSASCTGLRRVQTRPWSPVTIPRPGRRSSTVQRRMTELASSEDLDG